jgi:hypothetical protein
MWIKQINEAPVITEDLKWSSLSKKCLITLLRVIHLEKPRVHGLLLKRELQISFWNLIPDDLPMQITGISE